MTDEPRAAGRAGRGALAWWLDRVFAIRPLLWVPAVAVYGAGSAWRSRDLGIGGFAPGPLAALLLILAAVHAGNAWRDREGDLQNRKRIPVGRDLVGGRSLLAMSLGALLVAAFLAWRASLSEQRLLLASLLLGVAYVAPPLELKRRPTLDLLSHGVGYGIVAFLLGATGARALGGADELARACVASLPYALGIMAVSLLTMLADREGDETSGQRTTAVALGPTRAAAAATALAWGAMGVGLWIGELAPALWGVPAATLLALGVDPRTRAAASWNALAIRLQLLFLAILAPQAPAPLAFALLIGVATEAYNRRRWGVRYPLRAMAQGSG